jgi:hypothetical protein
LQNLGAEPFSDNERDNFAEFSDLYLCLLSAALDEMSSSVAPQMSAIEQPCQLQDFESFPDQGLRNEETQFF